VLTPGKLLVKSPYYDMALFVLISTIIILLMGVFIFAIVFMYRKKQIAYNKTIEQLRFEHEKSLLHTQLEIQEQTFQNISREIHDNISLSLTLAKLNLNTLEWDCHEKAKNQVDSTLEQLSKAIDDLRDISKSMNSELITSQGLLEVLKRETRKLKELDLFALKYLVTGTPVFMDSQKELIIFRIIQEAFNNIIKHSKATAVELNLNYYIDYVQVCISDNGKGFYLDKVVDNKESSAGLNNMRQRALLFNGKTIIESLLGYGTKVWVTIPY
jgi:signal transduction histidine kinase